MHFKHGLKNNWWFRKWCHLLTRNEIWKIPQTEYNCGWRIVSVLCSYITIKLHSKAELGKTANISRWETERQTVGLSPCSCVTCPLNWQQRMKTCIRYKGDGQLFNFSRRSVGGRERTEEEAWQRQRGLVLACQIMAQSHQCTSTVKHLLSCF